MVAILFARKDSIYKSLPETDVYDIERDARTFPGGIPVIAHPPCRAWGRLAHFAKPRHDEKSLAIFGVKMVQTFGGVLEHPASSKLWKECNLPLGNQRDIFGGFTLSIDQFWFGHKAPKKTWLYIVGVDPPDLPPYKIDFGVPAYVVNTSLRAGNARKRPEITKQEREHTPLELAEWLIRTAKLCSLKTPAPAAVMPF